LHEDETEAGCYEAEAENFGLEATFGLEDLTSLADSYQHIFRMQLLVLTGGTHGSYIQAINSPYRTRQARVTK